MPTCPSHASPTPSSTRIPHTRWWTWTLPTRTLRNGPMPAAMAYAMPRATRKVERHRGQEEPFVTRLGKVAAIERERRDRRAQPEVAQDDDEGDGGDRHRQQRRPEPARRHPVRRALTRATKASSVSTSRRSAQTLSRPCVWVTVGLRRGGSTSARPAQ